MVSVGENGLAAEVGHLLHGESLDGGSCGGADKSWRVDVAMRGMDNSDAGEAGLMFDIEL